jgi:hypothetical protein
MNAMPGGRGDGSSMRASDADRDRVLAELSQHFQAGRLTADELDERNGRALSARTLGELDALLSDLPALNEQRPFGPTPATVKRGGFLRNAPPAALIAPALVVAGVLALVLTVLGHGVGHVVVAPVVIVLVLVRLLGGGGRRRRRF